MCVGVCVYAMDVCVSVGGPPLVPPSPPMLLANATKQRDMVGFFC